MAKYHLFIFISYEHVLTWCLHQPGREQVDAGFLVSEGLANTMWVIGVAAIFSPRGTGHCCGILVLECLRNRGALNKVNEPLYMGTLTSQSKNIDKICSTRESK